MKRVINILLSFTLLFFSIPTFEKTAYAEAGEIFTYSIGDGEALIMSCDSYAQTFASENSIAFEIIDESINNEYSLNIANPIYDSASNSVNLSVAINNPNLKATNARIIIAVYDFSGELVKLKGTTDENILLYGVETTTLQRSMEISGGLPAGYTVKAFLWNDQMKPLAQPAENTIQNDI